MQDDKKKSKLINLSPEVDELLRQAAEKEHRSVANLIEYLILKYLNKI